MRLVQVTSVYFWIGQVMTGYVRLGQVMSCYVRIGHVSDQVRLGHVRPA